MVVVSCLRDCSLILVPLGRRRRVNTRLLLISPFSLFRILLFRTRWEWVSFRFGPSLDFQDSTFFWGLKLSIVSKNFGISYWCYRLSVVCGHLMRSLSFSRTNFSVRLLTLKDEEGWARSSKLRDQRVRNRTNKECCGIFKPGVVLRLTFSRVTFR